MRPYLLVAIGGAFGASIRWGVGELLPTDTTEFPWATLLVNVLGCLLIGFAARHVVRGTDRWLISVTGVLGGLTTFSTFSDETRALIDGGRSGLAMVYVAVTVMAGLAATEIARELPTR